MFTFWPAQVDFKNEKFVCVLFFCEQEKFALCVCVCVCVCVFIYIFIMVILSTSLCWDAQSYFIWLNCYAIIYVVMELFFPADTHWVPKWVRHYPKH